MLSTGVIAPMKAFEGILHKLEIKKIGKIDTTDMIEFFIDDGNVIIKKYNGKIKKTIPSYLSIVK